MVERLYYADSFLKNFDAVVSDVREHSRKDGSSVWQIALDRTAFYPTSGGQPCDMGSLTATAPSGATLTLSVVQVDEDEAGEVWHATSKPLPAGTRVKAVIDWPRRLDHIQQHSGQHLLSAIAHRDFGAATVSFHLGEELPTIDLAGPTLTAEEMERLEQTVNAAIAEDLPVEARTVTAAEARELLAKGMLRKLPEREGPMRLIEIADLDLNACGGTHVRALGQIGGLFLRGTEKVKQGVRLRFVCGQRAVRAARRDDQLLTSLAAGLSAQRDALPEMFERKLAEMKSLAKERVKLREELADYHTSRLLVEDPIQGGRRLVVRTYADRDAGYIKLLASRVVAASPQTMVLFASRGEEPASVVFGRSADVLHVHCGELLGRALEAEGLRGGGSAGLSQGQVPVGMLDKVFTALLAEVRVADAAAAAALA